MKTKFLPILLFIFLSFNLSNAQIFVDASAMDGGDGSTWATAFNDLQDALLLAEDNGSIWVAAGVYIPSISGGSTLATFSIDKNIVILGGFAGDETNPDDRDPEANETILSGDLNGDDEPGNFDVNKSDNVNQVVTVTQEVSSDAVIDGFTIRGGYAKGNFPNYSGGGMYCWGAPIIRQCLFEDNSSFALGGGIWFRNNPGVTTTVENCRFIGNRSRLGNGVDVRFRDITFADCLFENNFSWESPGLNLERNGGGMFTQNSNCVVTNCTFSTNTVAGAGGGILYWVDEDGENLSLEMDGCTFSGNSADTGGGLFTNPWGENISISVTNSEFLNNSSGNGYGGGANAWMANGNAWGDMLFDNCLFEGNTAANSSGGLDIGSWPMDPSTPPSHYTISNCQFINNEAEIYAGGMDIWAGFGANAEFEVMDCLFDGNSGGMRTGALWVLTQSDGFSALVERCEFRNNQSDIGAAVDFNQLDLAQDGPLPENAELILSNCLIADNAGNQAVFTLDSFPNVQVINSTIANNTGGGIQLENQSGITLQNTILHNNGTLNFEASTADVSVTSTGGNLISDESFNDYASLNDLLNADPVLTVDYLQTALSPTIDLGVDAGNLAEFDLAGNPRINGCVDIGAYESDITLSMDCLTSTREAIVGKKSSLSPNPATSFIQFQLPEAGSHNTTISLFDARGRLVEDHAIPYNGQIAIGHLPKGYYTLKLTNQREVYVGRFVKQ